MGSKLTYNWWSRFRDDCRSPSRARTLTHDATEFDAMMRRAAPHAVQSDCNNNLKTLHGHKAAAQEVRPNGDFIYPGHQRAVQSLHRAAAHQQHAPPSTSQRSRLSAASAVDNWPPWRPLPSVNLFSKGEEKENAHTYTYTRTQAHRTCMHTEVHGRTYTDSQMHSHLHYSELHTPHNKHIYARASTLNSSVSALTYTQDTHAHAPSLTQHTKAQQHARAQPCGSQRHGAQSHSALHGTQPDRTLRGGGNADVPCSDAANSGTDVACDFVTATLSGLSWEELGDLSPDIRRWLDLHQSKLAGVSVSYVLGLLYNSDAPPLDEEAHHVYIPSLAKQAHRLRLSSDLDTLGAHDLLIHLDKQCTQVYRQGERLRSEETWHLWLRRGAVPHPSPKCSKTSQAHASIEKIVKKCLELNTLPSNPEALLQTLVSWPGNHILNLDDARIDKLSNLLKVPIDSKSARHRMFCFCRMLINSRDKSKYPMHSSVV